jgi:hypothetical protein
MRLQASSSLRPPAQWLRVRRPACPRRLHPVVRHSISCRCRSCPMHTLAPPPAFPPASGCTLQSCLGHGASTCRLGFPASHSAQQSPQPILTEITRGHPKPPLSYRSVRRFSHKVAFQISLSCWESVGALKCVNKPTVVLLRMTCQSLLLCSAFDSPSKDGRPCHPSHSSSKSIYTRQREIVSS